MTKPEPVEPPSEPLASIETTEGSTRFAIPATESGERSIVEFEETNLVEYPKREPLDAAPKAPAIIPTKIVVVTEARKETFIREREGAFHQGLLAPGPKPSP